MSRKVANLTERKNTHTKYRMSKNLDLTQSKSKTTITRSVRSKFNCITVKYDAKQVQLLFN